MKKFAIIGHKTINKNLVLLGFIKAIDRIEAMKKADELHKSSNYKVFDVIECK